MENNIEIFKEAIQDRIKEFATPFNKYEHKELTKALKTILELVPPYYFDGLRPEDFKNDNTYPPNR